MLTMGQLGPHRDCVCASQAGRARRARPCRIPCCSMQLAACGGQWHVTSVTQSVVLLWLAETPQPDFPEGFWAAYATAWHVSYTGLNARPPSLQAAGRAPAAAPRRARPAPPLPPPAAPSPTAAAYAAPAGGATCS
jgi:hypothetical protein